MRIRSRCFAFAWLCPAACLGEPSRHAPPEPTGWASITAGALHTCGLRLDHTLWCWGRNDEGQLGVDVAFEADTPTQVPGTWTSVSAGAAQTCAIDDGENLWCWGDNLNGALGVGV